MDFFKQQDNSMSFWRKIDDHLGQILSFLSSDEKLNPSLPVNVFVDLEQGINNLSTEEDICKNQNAK